MHFEFGRVWFTKDIKIRYENVFVNVGIVTKGSVEAAFGAFSLLQVHVNFKRRF